MFILTGFAPKESIGKLAFVLFTPAISNLTSLFGNIDGLIKGIALPSTELSSVSITYNYDLPLFLKFTGLKDFNIKTKLFVLAGSGCKNSIHNRQ